MKAFAQLFQALDATTAQSAKLAALVAYLRVAPPADTAWATYFLAGGKPRQMVPTKRLKALAQEAAGLPEWLFEESYQAVGDLAETLALLLPLPTQPTELTLAEWMAQLLPLRALPQGDADTRLRTQWDMLAPEQRFVYFKLITGNFRVGVSRLQVTQALATVAEVSTQRVAQRLMGYTHIGAQHTAADYAALVAPESPTEQNQQTSGQPYPFFLAHPFNEALERFDELLGSPADWQVEWKWDGIRVQLVRAGDETKLFSRSGDDISGAFPDIIEAAKFEGVIDGELLVRGEAQGHEWLWEVRSVNGKTLDLRLRLPEWIDGLEPLVRKAVSAVAARGNISVSLRVKRGDQGQGIRVSEQGLAAAISALKQVETAAMHSGLTLNPLTSS